MERIPDFFIVGAAKSGTTSLWEFLGKHSSIFMTNDIRIKELGYFSNDYGITDIEEYLSYFKDAARDQLIGEVCHAYLTSHESPGRIISANPDAKVIIVLRNPAKRAFSLYNFMFMEGYENIRSFEEALKEEENRLRDPGFKTKSFHPYFRNYFYFTSGLYFEQVNNYFNVLGRNKCLVILFEDFVKSPHKTVQNIEKFLQIPHFLEDKYETVNESKSLYLPNKQFYFRIELPWKLMKLGIGKRRAFKIAGALMRLNTRSKKPKELSVETYNALLNRYSSDIENLSGLLGKDLKQIWK